MVVVLWGVAGFAGEAVFVVEDKVVVPAGKMEPIGVNRFGDPGGARYSHNMFIRAPGCEPIELRFLARVCSVDKDGGVRIDCGTSGWNGTYRTGLFSGAVVRVYRLVDEKGHKLPLIPARKGDYMTVDASHAARFVFVGKTRVVPPGDKRFPMGGWIAATKPHSQKPGLVQDDPTRSRVYFTDNLHLYPGDYLIFEKTWLSMDPKTVSAEKFLWSWRTKNCVLRFEPHKMPLPREMRFAGRGCLRIDAQEGNCIIEQPYLFGGGGWYGTLETGKKYRFEVWLKAEGLKGKVVFSFTRGQDVRAEFDVGEHWRRYVCDFVAQKAEKRRLCGVRLSFRGPGTLWLDCCRIFRYEDRSDLEQAYVVGRRTLARLLDSQPTRGHKGALRIWDGLRRVSMRALLSLYGGSTVRITHKTCYIRGTGSIARALFFAEATGRNPQQRMVPWLIIQVLFSEEEYRGLIEYLAEPYDPRRDTPQQKPWAYMRFLQRGHGRPWIDDFREIIIEFGNETWHNRLFADWIGFGQFCAVHQGGREYGLWARYVIENMRKHPAWQRASGKIKFCLGGNYAARIDEKTKRVSGYGQEASQACRLNAYEGHAVYVGRLWELGEQGLAELSRDGWQATLLAYQVYARPRYEKIGQAHKLLLAQGLKQELVSYEGGPSGFPLPHRASKDAVRISNIYGHSLAMAVAALQCWLDTYRLGWRYHCYFFFGQGQNWASHTYDNEGCLPSPAFLAMKLRNRLLRGDMLRVTAQKVPTFRHRLLPSHKRRKRKPLKSVDVPSVVCYAFRAGCRYAIAFLSLQLEDATKVVVRLPFKSAKSITLWRLTGAPQDTNLTEQKVRIVRQPVRTTALQNGLFRIGIETGGVKGGLPPAAIFVYVFDK